MGELTNKELKEKVRRRLMGKRAKDLLVFLFFVLICSVFWFVQELEETFTTEVSIPLKLENVPDGIIITTELPKELRLTLRDKGTDLLPFIYDNNHDTLRINFKNYDNNEPSGRGILLLSDLQTALKNILPDGATVLGMNPDTISFYFNRGLHRRLPVVLQGTLEASDQYCVTSYRFSPDSVEVYAPHNVLDTMRAAYTTRQAITDLKRSSDLRFPLQMPKGVRIFPANVTAKVNVDVLTRETIEVPIVGLNFPANKTLRTFPSTVTLTFLVPANRKTTISTEDFVVAITYAELIGNNTQKCHPHITNQPEGVSGALIDPVEVDYLLENVDTSEE